MRKENLLCSIQILFQTGTLRHVFFRVPFHVVLKEGNKFVSWRSRQFFLGPGNTEKRLESQLFCWQKFDQMIKIFCMVHIRYFLEENEWVYLIKGIVYKSNLRLEDTFIECLKSDTHQAIFILIKYMQFFSGYQFLLLFISHQSAHPSGSCRHSPPRVLRPGTQLSLHRNIIK